MVIPAPGTPTNPGQFQPGEFNLTPATPGPQLIRDVDGRVVGSTTEQAARAASESTGITSQEKVNIVIQKPKFDNSSLRYPSDPPIREDSDYVVFNFYKYAPPFGGGRDTPNRALPGSTSTTGKSTAGYSNYQSSNDRSYANPSKKLKAVIMYMPEDIQSQFGAGWNGAGFGASAIGLMNLGGAATTQKDIGQQAWAGLGSVPGVIKASIFKAMVDGINVAAGANINLNQALGTITGTIINPNVELAYEAPKLRTFSLKFKLVPRSDDEAKKIREICNTFKKAMLPGFGGQAIGGIFQQAGNLLTIPDLCQVSFMHKSGLHPYLPKYKLCGITDVNINYTASGAYATYKDGSPVSTELTISFIETKLVFSEEVDLQGKGI